MAEATPVFGHDEAMTYINEKAPSIYASCIQIFKELEVRLTDFVPSKILDFGAGSGQNLWAATHIWGSKVRYVSQKD